MAKEKWNVVLYDPRIGKSIFDKNLSFAEAKEEVKELRSKHIPAFYEKHEKKKMEKVS